MTAPRPTSVQLLPVGGFALVPARSTASYSSRHMFGIGTVHAIFAVVSGRITIADPIEASRVEATLDAGSFRSGNARRDRDVASARLLDVAHFPTIGFSATSLHRDPDGLVVPGEVAAHGAVVPVRVRVATVEAGDEGIRVTARVGHLDRYAFGITGSKGLVGRYLDLDLDVLAVPD